MEFAYILIVVQNYAVFMMNDLSVNAIDAVIVKDMSRIGRNVFDVLSLLRDWKEQGIELLTADEL